MCSQMNGLHIIYVTFPRLVTALPCSRPMTCMLNQEWSTWGVTVKGMTTHFVLETNRMTTHFVCKTNQRYRNLCQPWYSTWSFSTFLILSDRWNPATLVPETLLFASRVVLLQRPEHRRLQILDQSPSRPQLPLVSMWHISRYGCLCLVHSFTWAKDSPSILWNVTLTSRMFDLKMLTLFLLILEQQVFWYIVYNMPANQA